MTARSAWVLALLLPAGCVSLPSGAFQSFHGSADKARLGLEAEMGRDVAWAREAELLTVADKPDAVLSGYLLTSPGGFAWSIPNPPAYWTARRSARALKDLNAAFLGYAALLSGLASGDVADAEQVDATAEALNEDLRAYSDHFTLAGKKDAPRISGLSAVVAESLRAFARLRRARDLRAALSANQPWVEAYAASSQGLIELIRGDMKDAYVDQSKVIQARWDDKRAPGRATLTRSLFNLNEEYVDAMASLEALSSFYAGLPAAHLELAKALKRGGRGRAALGALAGSAARVARLSRELDKGR